MRNKMKEEERQEDARRNKKDMRGNKMENTKK